MASRRSSGLVGAARKIGARFGAFHFGQILAGFFHNHVSDQNTIRAGCGRIVGKSRKPVAQNRIEIGEDHETRIGPRGANLPWRA